MDRIRLFKYNDENVKEGGWEDLEDLAKDTGYTVEELKSWWFVEEVEDYNISPVATGPIETFETNVIMRSRVYPSSVEGKVISRSDNDIILEVEDGDASL